MIQKFSLFIVLLGMSATSLLLGVQVSAGQTIGEENDTSMQGNNTSNETSPVAQNNTIVLNAAEAGKEKYRWEDASGAMNPTLNITANQDYTIKISNPTDEEHQLIIDSKADGKTSQIAKSKEIKPESKNVELDFKTDQTGELGYHCKYHPDIMKGTIKVTQ